MRAAEGRRQLRARYSDGVAACDVHGGMEHHADLGAADFDSIEVQKLTREEASSWPPGPGEIVLEKSVLQVKRFSIGETITVETETGSRAELRVVGFAHDINAVPAMFSDMVVGYVSMGTLVDAQGARQVQLPRAPARPGALAGGSEPHRGRRPRQGAWRRGRPGAADDRAQAGKPLPRRHLQGGLAAAARARRAVACALRLPGDHDDLGAHGAADQADRHHEGGRGRGGVRSCACTWRLVALYGVLAVLVGVPLRSVGRALVHQLRRRPAQLPRHRLESARVRHRARGRRRAARALCSPPSCRFVEVRERAWSPRSTPPASRPTSVTGSSTGRSASSAGCRGRSRCRCATRSCARAGSHSRLTTLILASAVVMAVLSVRASTLKTVDDIARVLDLRRAGLLRPAGAGGRPRARGQEGRSV